MCGALHSDSVSRQQRQQTVSLDSLLPDRRGGQTTSVLTEASGDAWEMGVLRRVPMTSAIAALMISLWSSRAVPTTAQSPEVHVRVDYTTLQVSLRIRAAEVWPTNPPDIICIEPPLGETEACLEFDPLEEYVAFPIIASGLVYTLMGGDQEGDEMLLRDDPITVFVPWNMQGATTQAGVTTLQWDVRESAFIESVEVEPAAIQLTSSTWTAFATNAAGEVEVSLSTRNALSTYFVFAFPDRPPHRRSLPWQCTGYVWTSTCASDETCVPATCDVFSNVQPEDYTLYCHTCAPSPSERASLNLSGVVNIDSPYGKIFFKHAFGIWSDNNNPTVEDLQSSGSCFHRSATQLLKYQCEGLQRSCEVNFALLTYAVDTDVDQECIPHLGDAYIVDYSLANSDYVICPPGSVLWNKTSTCYFSASSSLSFGEARRICQEKGGDILYSIADDDNGEQFAWIVKYSGLTYDDEIWSMGLAFGSDRSLFLNVPTEMISPSVLNSNGSFPDTPPYTDTRHGVCVAPGRLFTSTTYTEALVCSDDQMGVCGSNGFCEPRSEALGEKSNWSNLGTMCYCNPNFYGPSCEYYDCDQTETIHALFNTTVSSSKPLQLKAPDGLLLAVEHAQMGQWGCRSPSVLGLLQLRCNGRSWCEVSESSLRSSGSSTCHRIVSDLQVWGRVAFVTNFTCNNDSQEIKDQIGCFILTPDVSAAQEAKEYCNLWGGDLSLFINDDALCLLDDSDIFTALMLAYEEPYFEFKLNVDEYEDLEYVSCGSGLWRRPMRGLCQLPPVPVYLENNNSSTPTYHLDVGTIEGRNLTVKWDSSIFETGLYVCLSTWETDEGQFENQLCKSPGVCNRSVTFASIVTGVPLVVRMRLNEIVLYESHLFIPSSLSVVPSGVDSALIFWIDTQYTPVAQIQYDGETHNLTTEQHQLQVSRADGAVQFVVSLCENQYGVLYVTADVAPTADEQYYGRTWQCISSTNVPCETSVHTLLPTLNSPYLDYLYETVVPTYFTEGIAKNSTYSLSAAANRVMNIVYASLFDDQTQCNLHSTLALLRFWCHGVSSCDIPQSSLFTYLQQIDDVEPDCTMTSSSIETNLHFYWNYTTMTSSNFEASLKCSIQDFVPFLNMCYGLSPISSFQEARAWCLQRGGDLAFETPDVTWEWYSMTFSSVSNPWMMGYSYTNRPVLPVLPTGLVEPNKLGTPSSARPCSSMGRCEDAVGLCVLPPLTADLTPVSDLVSSKCQENFCFNGGTCWVLTDESFMCDCQPRYFGDFCEEEDAEQQGYSIVEMEYNTTAVLHLEATAPFSIYVEFALLGSTSFGDGSQSIEEADPNQGCLAPLFLQVLRARCNGRHTCSMSARDARHHIASQCAPVVTPRLRVRYSPRLRVTECPVGGLSPYMCYTQTGLPRGCYKATLAPSRSDLQQACLDDGGDLLFSSGTSACLCARVAGPALYAGDFCFWNTSAYSSRVSSYEELACDGESPDVTRALCMYPLTTTCPQDIPFEDVYPTYTFPSSPVGVAVQGCPLDFVGVAVRLCGTNGSWITLPDLANCTNLDVAGYEEELTSPNRTRTAAEVLASVNAEVAELAYLAPGDVVSLGELLLLGQGANRQDLEATQVLQEQVDISELMFNTTAALSNRLLSNSSSWIGLRVAVVNTAATSVQRSVREAGLQRSAFVNGASLEMRLSALHTRLVSEKTSFYYNEENRSFSGDRSTIRLPDNFFGECEDEEIVRVVFAGYSTLVCILNQLSCTDAAEDDLEVEQGSLVSEVLGADVWNCRSPWNESWSAGDSDSEVIAKFSHVAASPGDGTNELKPNCVFWNDETETWSTEGCSVVYSDGHDTTCQCDHLTNLAIIMDINGVINGTIIEPITEWLTVLGCSTSVVCLVITATVLLGFQDIRHRGSNIIRANLCICLAIAEFILLVGLDRTENSTLCSIIAGCLQYFFLATFAWSSLESFALYLRLVKVMGVDYSVPKEYYLYGYGAPLLLVVTTAATTKGKGFGTASYCWLDPETGLVWAFAGPLACILVVNSVAFIMTVMVMVENYKKSPSGRRNALTTSLSNATTKSMENRRLSSRIYGSIGIFLYLCLTWIFGFFYTSEASAFMAIPFVLLNSLQGLVIFFTTILKDDFIMGTLSKKLRIEKLRKLRGSIGSSSQNFASKATRSSTAD